MAMRWRWLESAPASGATQMAVDVALMAHARRTGESTLRVYEWSRPTLSFGRNEPARDRFSGDSVTAAGYDVVRRPTGGRVLLHDGDVTYSVTAPAANDDPIRAAFARINELLADGLRRLGVNPEPATIAVRERRPGRDACFAAPSAGELVVAGRKLVASAQRREDGAMLQHGSILMVDRQGALSTLARGGIPVPAAAATLESVLGRPVERVEVHRALKQALEVLVGDVEPHDPADIARLAAPLVAGFSDSAWTWRR